jgi:MarR-like DNA-binding transcriptional regulator SgrR of sgrS sRNA
VVRAADGTLAGTGPFQIAAWELGKSATLTAHERYWGGRPYLDAINIQMGRTLNAQFADFQVGKSDVVEATVRNLRGPRQRGIIVFATPPMETLALQFENGGASDAVREALALSIDRVAIHTVLLQNQGEVSGALLPKWLSGYSFLFPVVRNVARARQIVPAPTSLMFAYDIQDPVIRAIAERISVNASEAGITLRPATAGAAPVRLARLPVTARDPWMVLEDFATLLRQPAPVAAGSPYEAERALIGNFQVIPLFHLPQVWMMQSRVRDWSNKDGGNWADAWLDTGMPQ